MKNLRMLDPALLVPMDIFTGYVPVHIDLAYAQPVPKSFCGIIYRPEARLWLHYDLARVVVAAAAAAGRDGYGMVLYDGLRTVEAQARMRETPIVKANPQWLTGTTRMLSPPGKGAHPRGMAVDLTLSLPDKGVLDMGTIFDAMPEGQAGPGPETNPAHRESKLVSAAAQANRALLTGYMMAGALRAGQFLMPLPQEWWDYRFMPMVYELYAPLADADLPPQMRMMAETQALDNGKADFDDAHFIRLRDQILTGAGIS